MQTKNIRRECKSVNDTHTDKQMTGIKRFPHRGNPERSVEGHNSKKIRKVLDTFCNKTQFSVVCSVF